MKSSGVGGGGTGVASPPPKVLMCWKSWQSPKIQVKMAPNVVWLQEMAPKVYIKTHENLFPEVTPKRGVHDLEEDNWKAKVAQKLFGQVWGISGKILRTPKICLLLHLWWKGTSAPVAPVLEGQRRKCPRHASILRRPCVYYSTRTLFTRCCRLQCVTVMNINYQQSPKTQ